MRGGFPNLPSCLPSLVVGLVPAGHHYYGGSAFCQPRQRISPTTAISFSQRHGRLPKEPGTCWRRTQSRCLSLDYQRSASDRPPCLSRLNFRTFRLQPPYCHFIALGLTRYRCLFHRCDCRTDRRSYCRLTCGHLRADCVRSKVRALLGHSPTGLAESSSPCGYGLFFHLRLLSTLSHDNAVTSFGYRSVTLTWTGLTPVNSIAFTGALAAGREPADVSQPSLSGGLRRSATL
jgi:hypothetical protein